MDKIKVAIPPGFTPEKEYIIGVLLSDFLGLDYTLQVSNTLNYILTLPNGKQLILQDAFFKHFEESEGYLHRKNIPNKATYTETDFSSEADVPVIFGDQNFKINENDITCGIDIFASSFFLLSRWEEYVITEKNENGNFPSEESFLQRNKIQHRPIVNEYVELLWNMLVHLGLKENRRPLKYTVKLTHDIDLIARYDNSTKYIKALAGDLILRKNPGLWLKTTSDYFKIKNEEINDPYDTFDFLMDVSEQNGLTSHFYFIPGLPSETDFRYHINDKRVIRAIDKIKERNHKIGIHPSFSSFKNKEQLDIEIARLEKHHSPITEGRQHYLKFSNPETWQDWEDTGLKYDSTIGYENRLGFRAGVCYEYPVFNILSRKKLNLIEQPLIFMESAVYDRRNISEVFTSELQSLVQTVKKYNGNFVFLWHNSNINTYEWRKAGANYPEIVKSLL